MSKTYQIIRGKKVMVRAKQRDRHKRGRKFFGFTSGQHSHGVYDHTMEDGKFINIKTDRAPIKGKDFVKYGYPFETRDKSVIKNNELLKQANDEIGNYYNGN